MELIKTDRFNEKILNPNNFYNIFINTFMEKFIKERKWHNSYYIYLYNKAKKNIDETTIDLNINVKTDSMNIRNAISEIHTSGNSNTLKQIFDVLKDKSDSKDNYVLVEFVYYLSFKYGNKKHPIRIIDGSKKASSLFEDFGRSLDAIVLSINDVHNRKTKIDMSSINKKFINEISISPTYNYKSGYILQYHRKFTVNFRSEILMSGLCYLHYMNWIYNVNFGAIENIKIFNKMNKVCYIRF